MSAARYALFRLDEAQPHTKNWRPQLLAFINAHKNDEDDTYSLRHLRVMNFLYQLKAGKQNALIVLLHMGEFDLGRGFVVAASILEGDYLENRRHIEPIRAVRSKTMNRRISIELFSSC